jgi:hypothetical protein
MVFSCVSSTKEGCEPSTRLEALAERGKPAGWYKVRRGACRFPPGRLGGQGSAHSRRRERALVTASSVPAGHEKSRARECLTVSSNPRARGKTRSAGLAVWNSPTPSTTVTSRTTCFDLVKFLWRARNVSSSIVHHDDDHDPPFFERGPAQQSLALTIRERVILILPPCRVTIHALRAAAPMVGGTMPTRQISRR